MTTNDRYNKLCDYLYSIIPNDELMQIINQEDSEYEYRFLGFLDIYDNAVKQTNKNMIIIDFGCYLAAQSYLFKDYKKYIGVDIINMKRFTPNNCEHYICTIQNFIKNYPEYCNMPNVFAICSYVPDNGARKLVKENFKNCLIYYPS